MLSLVAIMVRKESPPPDWWRVGRDFPWVARKSRTNRWELTVPSSWPLVASKDAPNMDHFSRPDSGVEMGPKIGYSLPRLGSRKRAPLISNDRPRFPGDPGEISANPGARILDPNRD